MKLKIGAELYNI